MLRRNFCLKFPIFAKNFLIFFRLWLVHSNVVLVGSRVQMRANVNGPALDLDDHPDKFNLSNWSNYNSSANESYLFSLKRQVTLVAIVSLLSTNVHFQMCHFNSSANQSYLFLFEEASIVTLVAFVSLFPLCLFLFKLRMQSHIGLTKYKLEQL